MREGNEAVVYKKFSKRKEEIQDLSLTLGQLNQDQTHYELQQ